MPLPFAPLVGIALGVALAWVARSTLAREEGPLVLLAGATVPVGFMVSARAARAQRLGTVALIGGVPATILAVLLIVWQRRLATSATYAQFHGDFGTQAITQATLGRGILWMAFVAALGIAWCGWNIRES